jgi:predicted  nucleic acid-binding Zn-ribbon protein
MSPDLERLIKLQELESTIADAKSASASQPERTADLDARLDRAKQTVDAARERLQQNQDARRAHEKDVALYQGRLSKFKEQLMAVKTNREYQAMQHEIETAQKDLGTVEERVLERMVEADELTAELKAAEAALQAQTTEIEAAKAELARETAAQEAALARASEARAGVVAEAGEHLVALFEQVARARKGVAICSATRDGLCSHCHVRLRPSMFQQVRQNDQIIQCESCRRVLYWVPPPPPVEPPVVHA